MTPRPVVVVGGGPAGAATAIAAARLGLPVTLVDRDRFPREKPCSEYMSPEAVRLLDGLGVVPALERAGAVALRGSVVVGPCGARLEGAFARAPGRPWRPTGLSVPRRTLDATLVEAARQAGVVVQEGVRVVGVRPGAVPEVALADGRGQPAWRPAALVIGADGLRTRIGRAIGKRRHGRPRRVAFVAHVAGVTGLDGSAEMHVGPRGYVGLNPIGPGLANVALVVPQRAAVAAAGRPTEFFLEGLEAMAGVAGRVPADGIRRAVLATGPFAARSSAVTAPGIALVGDAADFFDPFTGEGIWSALRGAELLERTILAALASGRDPAAAAAAYRAGRRRAFAGKWAVERLIAWAMAAPPLFDRAVARLGARAGMADTLVGVTGAITPARAVLNPWFLARMMV